MFVDEGEAAATWFGNSLRAFCRLVKRLNGRPRRVAPGRGAVLPAGKDAPAPQTRGGWCLDERHIARDTRDAAQGGRVVRVADGTGKGISRVGGRGAIESQQVLHHLLDLRLGGAPGAGHRLLDLQGSVFVHFEIAVGQGAERGTACLAEQQGRLRVDVDEDLFQRRRVGLRIGRDLAQAVEDHFQACVQGLVGGYGDRAAGDVREAYAVGVDDTEPGAAQPRVDPQNADPALHDAPVAAQCRK